MGLTEDMNKMQGTVEDAVMPQSFLNYESILVYYTTVKI